MRTLIRKPEFKVLLKMLDRLIQEVLMATAVNVKDIHTTDDKVTLMDMVATSNKFIPGV